MWQAWARAHGQAHGTIARPAPPKASECVLCRTPNARVRLKFSDRRICEDCRLDVDVAVIYTGTEE